MHACCVVGLRTLSSGYIFGGMQRLAPCAAAALAGVVLAGCAANEEVAARVGNSEIAAEQRDAGVEHIVEELQREGREVATEGSPGFERLRAQVLGVLVYREQVEQAAARSGIRWSEEEVERRLARSGEDESEEGASEAFLAGAVHTQVVLEAVARSLDTRISVTEREVASYYRSHAELFVTPPTTLDEARARIRRELLAEKRNAALRRWIALARSTIPVRYEPGFESP